MVVTQKQLRHIFTVTSGSTPESGNTDYWDGNIQWATPEDVSSLKNYWLKNTRRKITKEGYESCGTTIAPINSILLTKRAPIGQLAILGCEMCSNQGCFLLTPRYETDTRFFYYWLSVNTSRLQILGRGSTFMELSTDELKSLKIPHPSLAKQRLIANYLDRETKRIDALVSTKEKFLELLNEEKQSLITYAITRGLNYDIPFQDSGVLWIGHIPCHWKIEKARWLFNERDLRSIAGEEELLTVSHITGVTPRSEKDVNMFEAETKEGYKVCFPGDLVINTLWAWMGAMGVSPLNGIVSPSYHVYSIGSQIIPQFIDLLVRLPIFAQEVIRHSKGVWTSRLRLYPEGFFEIYLPVPPLEEQYAIVEYLLQKTNNINAIYDATEKSIKLLKERREALITRVVNGQIEIGEEK